MSARDLFTFRNRHFTTGVGITVAMLIVTTIAGFIVLPFAQPWVQFANVWDAICSAAGVPRRSANVAAPEQTKRLSEVVLTSHTLSRPSQEAIGIVTTIRSWWASQASSNHEMSATASSPGQPSRRHG